MYAYSPPATPVSLEPKPTSAARTALASIMGVNDTNLHGNVHGGTIMKMCDGVAGAVAARHCGGRAVTVAMDEMVLLVPVRIGDLVRAEAQVNWAGRTSMEIGVRVTAERWDDTSAPPSHTASAYLVFVALDEDGSPREVPPVVPETASDERRFAEAVIRRDARLARRAAIEASRQDDGMRDDGTRADGGLQEDDGREDREPRETSP